MKRTTITNALTAVLIVVSLVYWSWQAGRMTGNHWLYQHAAIEMLHAGSMQ